VDPLLRECPPEPERRQLQFLGSRGHDQTDGYIVQAPNRELQHASRGGVKPLWVVDRKQGGSCGGESEERSAKGTRNRPLIGERPHGFPAKESDFKSRSLGGRKSLETLVGDPL
jgi:hypothetical protein